MWQEDGEDKLPNLTANSPESPNHTSLPLVDPPNRGLRAYASSQLLWKPVASSRRDIMVFRELNRVTVAHQL